MTGTDRTRPAKGDRLELEITARAENLRAVRRAIEEMDLPAALLDLAKLLTTELVSNSIRHAGVEPDEFIGISATWSGAVLRVVVLDHGSRPPPVVAGSIRPGPGAESGWGLYLVDLLSSRWGANLGGSRGFWFELEPSEI